jgi:hypothetical protein
MTKRTNDSVAGRWKPPATESLHPATDLAAANRQLLDGGQRRLDAAALREALVDLHELWLTTKAGEIGITAGSGFAIVATGGLGRRELAPYSDLDLMLLHDNMPTDVVTQVADLLWYPLWDANIRLDHSVRTVSEAITFLRDSLRADDVVLVKGRETQRLTRIILALAGRNVRCQIEQCRLHLTFCDDCPLLEHDDGPQPAWPERRDNN